MSNYDIVFLHIQSNLCLKPSPNKETPSLIILNKMTTEYRSSINKGHTLSFRRVGVLCHIIVLYKYKTMIISDIANYLKHILHIFKYILYL